MNTSTRKGPARVVFDNVTKRYGTNVTAVDRISMDFPAGALVTLINGFLTFVPPLVGWGRPPAFAEYLFFATIETVATSAIIWQAWTWSTAPAAG